MFAKITRSVLGLAAFLLIFSGVMAQAQTSPVIEVRNYTRPFGKTVGAELMDDRLLPFAHGVASGDPLSDRVILWTRVTVPSEQTVPVQWRVATDPQMTNIVASGSTSTSQDRDYMVKVDASGLQAATTYYYNFTALGKTSLTGRTRTAPSSSTPADRLRFAVVSCSNYDAGFFNAYGRIADRADLDAVIHLGDYIYEYAPGVYGGEPSRSPSLRPTSESVTLNDYRLRYSTYRLDPDLIRAHQQHPFITIWDDHETANDAYVDSAENHNGRVKNQGTWTDRKAAGKRTYFEWMPIREQATPNAQRIYRTVNYGALADFIMLDTRLEGRQQQIIGQDAGANGGVIKNAQDSARWLDTARTMLGQAQLDWLRTQLSASRAKWKILGNQTQLMSVKRPIIPGQSNGGFLSLDAWDGYPAERLKLLNFIRTQNIGNVAVITGDIHSSWAADIPLDPFSTQSYTPQTGAGSVAVEFVTPSVTAANFDEVFAPLPRALITQFLINPSLPLNPHVKMLEGFENGYMVIDVANDKMQSDWFFVDTLKLRTTRERFYQGWLTTDGSKRLTQASAPAPAKANSPVAAPIATSVATNDPTFAANNRIGFAVIGNYPNPASDATVINYVLAMPKHVVIKLYDVAGKELYTLLDERQSPGNYGIALSVSKLPSGTYFYRCEMDGVSVTRSLSVIR